MNDVNTADGGLSKAPGDDYSFSNEVRTFWRQLPNKALFFPLLIAWMGLFQFLGNSTFGYVETGSMFNWMFNAYTKETDVADDGHGIIMPFVVVGLMWWKREQLLAQSKQLWGAGLLLLLVAMALHVLGYMLQQTRVSIIAFFLGVYGLMGLTWGWRFLRAIIFPFVLLVFMVPLGSLTEKVTFPLRLLVNNLSVFIGREILGFDVMAVGTQLISPLIGFKYEIAVPCSGMRSLIAITLIAIVYATVALRGKVSKLILVAAAVPLAVIGNTFRLLLIIIAGQLAGTFGEFFHWLFGWPVSGQAWGDFVHKDPIFSLTPYVPAIFGLIWLGGKLERRQNQSLAEVRKESRP